MTAEERKADCRHSEINWYDAEGIRATKEAAHHGRCVKCWAEVPCRKAIIERGAKRAHEEFNHLLNEETALILAELLWEEFEQEKTN